MMLVDGYNVIHAWHLDTHDLNAARDLLIHTLDDYAGYSGEDITIVFDGYNTRAPMSEELHGRITVVYTAYGVTADTHIQRAVSSVSRQMRVVTADYMEQLSVAAAGAIRITPSELRLMIADARRRHIAHIDRSSLTGRDLKAKLMRDAIGDDRQ